MGLATGLAVTSDSESGEIADIKNVGLGQDKGSFIKMVFDVCCIALLYGHCIGRTSIGRSRAVSLMSTEFLDYGC